PHFKLTWNFTWLDFGNVPGVGPLQIKMGVLLDSMTSIMLVVVTLISFLVHLFSTGYMAGDKRYGRYFAFLGIFTFSMIGIVLSDNLFSIYIFWELVGLSSYLLIGFFFEKDSAADAQKKAFLTNRIGDIGMWLGILILYSQFHTFGYQEIFDNIRDGKFHLSEGWLTAAGILLFFGCVGKSAQFPLHVWLPDAMEGPTPVSALIHAATMVAAGVYFVARIFVLLTPDALHFIAFTGAGTAFMAATIAITQNDIKRVLAYSTVSQLGYMVMGLGVGSYAPAFFHLVTHAFFKACLFLGSGAVIHATHHEQDMRWMGGLRKDMPWTFATFSIAMLALSGLPLTSGFMSKDAILAGALGFASVEGGIFYLIPVFGFGAAMLTAFYMGRQMWLVFFGENRAHLKPAEVGDHGHGGHDDHHAHGHDDHGHDDHGHGHSVHEVSWEMRLPLVVLSMLSIFFIYSFNPLDGAQGWFLHVIQTPETVVKLHDAPSHAEPHAINTHETATPVVLASVSGEAAGHGEAGAAAHGEGHGPVFSDPRQAEIAHATHAAHYPAIMFSTVMLLLGFSLATVFYFKGIVDPDKTASAIRPLYLYSYNKWYWDEIYNATIISGSMMIAKTLSWFDKNIVDGIVNGIGSTVRWFAFRNGDFDRIVVDGLVNLTGFTVQFTGLVLRKIQTGRVQTYVALLLVAVVGYFIYSFVNIH
ncbi:MAG: NADH-quinone oxidoreductase subunit L, partial [Chlorobiales bacterium]|nr:NADH-quinone oxidoreductase subunit L [Chlorobiales bacterium]